MQSISNNELSRRILACLKDHYPQAMKFADLVKALNIDEKAIYKNLFFLEEKSFAQLMSSYPPGATYPTIHMVKLREEGKTLIEDEEELDDIFPLTGLSSRLDPQKIDGLTLAELFGALTRMIEQGKIVTGRDRKELANRLSDLAADRGLAKTTLGRIFRNL